MQTTLYRRAALFSVLAAAIFLAACAPVTMSPKSALLPGTPGPALPPALSGEKTPGCDHILKVLRALQDASGSQRKDAVTFEFTEAEVNEYLAYSLRIKPRLGVSGLAVRFFPDNEISVLAKIDLAGVRKWNDWLIPATLLPAFDDPRPVQVDLKFQASDGFGTFKLKNVIGPGNVVIPKPAMEWILQAIALHQPEWYDTSKDIALPFHLQRVWTAKQALLGAM